MSRESDYVTEVRQANREVWEGILKLLSLQKEWNALDYSQELNDFVGENAHLNATQVGAVVFDTANALETLLQSGHATNMATLL